MLPGNTSTATPLAQANIIQSTAVPAMPASLQKEVRAQVAALRGIPNDTLNDYWSRGEIRAYILLRAFGVGYKTTQYTPEDSAIASYVNVWIYQENAQIFTTTVNLCNSFSSHPCSFQLLPDIIGPDDQDPLSQVKSYCNPPIPPGLGGIHLFLPVPPATRFWSCAKAIVLNNHFHDWGTHLFGAYGTYYLPPDGPVDVINALGGVTYHDPSSYTKAGAAEYVAAVEGMDEGTTFLVNQFAQYPAATNPSPAQAALDSRMPLSLRQEFRLTSSNSRRTPEPSVVSDNGRQMFINSAAPVLSFSGYFTYAEPLILQAFDASMNKVITTASVFSNNMALSGDPPTSPNEFIQVSFARGISGVAIIGDPDGGSFVLADATYSTFSNAREEAR